MWSLLNNLVYNFIEKIFAVITIPLALIIFLIWTSKQFIIAMDFNLTLPYYLKFRIWLFI